MCVASTRWITNQRMIIAPLLVLPVTPEPLPGTSRGHLVLHLLWSDHPYRERGRWGLERVAASTGGNGGRRGSTVAGGQVVKWSSGAGRSARSSFTMTGVVILALHALRVRGSIRGIGRSGGPLYTSEAPGAVLTTRAPD